MVLRISEQSFSVSTSPEEPMESKLEAEAVSQKIIRKVAEAKGVSPLEFTPLGRVIDSEALDEIFSTSSNTEKELRFSYEGYTVVVDGQGGVRLE